MNVSEVIDEIEAAMVLEDLDAARILLSNANASDAQEEWQLEVMRHLMADVVNSWDESYVPLDERAILLRGLADDQRAFGSLKERAFLTSIQPVMVRRLHARALELLDAWEASHGQSGRTAAARADIYLAMDEPLRAKEFLSEIDPELGGDFVVSRLMRVHYVVADFDAAERYAGQLRGTPFALEALDGLGGISAARGDLEAELAAVTEAIELAARSEDLAGRLWHRALVYASLDRLSEARADLERALAAVPAQSQRAAGRQIRHRLDALDAAHSGARSARLTAFPTIVQKWNYCGPAVIELCLRYAGIEMTQELIAEAVKRGDGTPTYAIVDFLREQGFEVRRVEATADGLRAAIDAGVPVIVESVGSNSSHVSVAIGYDDRLGVLIVADPMTHVPTREGLELRGKQANTLRYGGIAVLGRAAEVTDATRHALDAAGLVESTAITRFDEIGRRWAESSDDFARFSPAEAAGIALEVLEAEPNYNEAARSYVQSLSNAIADEESSDAANAALVSARSRFPTDAVIAGLAAAWYRFAGEPEFSIGEAMASVALDPGAAEPRRLAGFHLANMGERAAAYEQASAGFVRAAHEPFHSALLADLATTELMARAQESGALGAFGTAFLADQGTLDGSDWNISDELLRPLAHSLVTQAMLMSQSDVKVEVAAGDLAMFERDRHGAREHFKRAAELEDQWFVPKLRLAYASAHDEPEAARALARQLLDWPYMPPAGWTALVCLAIQLDDVELAERAIARTLDVVLDPSTALRAYYDGVKAKTHSDLAAARAVSDLAKARPQDDDVLNSVAGILGRLPGKGHAIELLRERVELVPEDVRSRHHLAALLSTTPGSVPEAIDNLDEAWELAPEAVVVVVALGWILLDTDPTRANAVAANIGYGSVLAAEFQRHVARRAWDATAVTRATEALERMCGSEFDASVAIALEHIACGRVDLAARTEIVGEPRDANRDAVLPWARALSQTGRSARVVDYVAQHPNLINEYDIALIVAFAGHGAHPELVARAARHCAGVTADAGLARVLTVAALCAEGAWEDAVRAAGDDPSALAHCAGCAAHADLEFATAQRAYELAPEDLAVASAWHAALLSTGRLEQARDTARVLTELFPYEHQGSECTAECEALYGDVDAAIETSRIAVAQDPLGVRALASAAVAHAVKGDWEGAAGYAGRLDGVRQSRAGQPELAPVRLVSAALASDRVAFEATLSDFATRARAYPLERVVEACEQRLAQPSDV